MDVDCCDNEIAAAMSSLSFEDSNAAFFVFNPPITRAIGGDEKVLYEYNVKVFFKKILLFVYYSRLDFLEARLD